MEGIEGKREKGATSRLRSYNQQSFPPHNLYFHIARPSLLWPVKREREREPPDYTRIGRNRSLPYISALWSFNCCTGIILYVFYLELALLEQLGLPKALYLHYITLHTLYISFHYNTKCFVLFLSRCNLMSFLHFFPSCHENWSMQI